MRKEGADLIILAAFYHAVLQAVLLYGIKNWVMLPVTLRVLEGFHIHYVCRMMDMVLNKRRNRTWKYPMSDVVLRVVSLQSIVDYIDVRR